MVDPIQGVENVTADSGDIFKTEFDATFNKFDMISLAASEDLLASVECANIGDSKGQIMIIFKNDIDPSLTDRMFQEGSLVIVDGSLFGSCDVAGDANKDFTTHPAFDGFVLIESVLTSGPEVTLIGEVGSLHYIFENLFIKSSLLQRRKLAAVGSEIHKTFTFKQPVDEPVYLESKLEFKGQASIDFSETSWNFFPKPKFHVACDFEFDIEVEFSSELHFKIDEDVLKPKQITYPSDDPSKWGPGWSIPIYNLPVPKVLEKVLNKFLFKSKQINLGAGLKLGFPLGGKLETATQVDVNMGGINMKATTGKKRVEFRYNGLETSIKTDFEDPSLVTSITGGPDKLDSFTAGLKLTGILGIRPQVVFESFGLATGSLGLYTGLFFEANYGFNPPIEPIEDNPGLPKLYGICDVFHSLQIKLDAGLGDFFLWYKLITDKEKVPVELPPNFEYELKFPLVTACLFGDNATATVDIEVDDLIVFGGGGEPNKVYVFTFLAHVNTATVKKIRFEWSPGVGAPDSAVSSVSNRDASTSVQLSYPKPGSYKLDVKLYDDDDDENRLLASSWVYVKIAGADLSIVPPTLDGAEVGVQYTFELSASGLDASEIKFGWSFGVGSGGTGSETVQVIDGEASISISHTYTEEGAFGLVASISEPFDDGVGTIEYIPVAERSLVVVVGEKIEREYDLDACDTWEVKTNGGQGVTIDVWNITTIPPGAIFDMKFDTIGIPDRIYVVYEDSVVESTGWRGYSFYNGDPLYPGGVTHPEKDIASDMFTRLSQDQDSFIVTVVGPDSGTLWNYNIRCRFNHEQEYNFDGVIQRKRFRGHFKDLSISG